MIDSDRIEWYKESRQFSNALIKHGEEYEMDAEELGYNIFKQLSIPTPKLFARTKYSVIIEHLDGPSIFEICKKSIQKNAKNQVILSILDSIQHDVRLFQDYTTKKPINNIDLYDSDNKFKAALKILKKYDNSAYNKVKPHTSLISKIFSEFSTVPFRDATLKNILVRNIDINMAVESILDGDTSLIINNRCHIDFRSLCEKTTVYDDTISIYAHSMFFGDIINSFENRHLHGKTQDIEFIVTKVIRLSRFWGRRQYYQDNDNFNKRYNGEDISFYRNSFVRSINELINII